MTTQPFKLTSEGDYASFVDAFDTFMFDCDGVLWHDESLIPGAAQLPKDEKVYVIETGLEEELDEEGIQHLGGTDPADKTFDVFDITKFDRDPKVTVVLAGYDGAINYTKLAKAMQYLTRNAG
ncbi:hypothetical protein FS837_012762 [Tulasnella sp. UAMH 9824]|nr:hypothetical protein FS837_012762 [Tulasnella sp. UAMH 9824]